jgi:hypothetical protein
LGSDGVGWGGGGCGEGKGDGDGGAEVGAGAGGGGVSAVLASYVANQEEAEACALDLGDGPAGNAVEAGEDALELVGREADAGVGDLERDGGVAGDGEGAADVDTVGGVFDGVVEDVEDGGAEVVGDAEGVEADGAGGGFEADAGGREVVALEGDGDAVGEEGFEIDEGAALLAVTLTELAGLEDLLDGGEEAVGVGEHDLVELLSLRLFDGAALEGFEVEADASDGSFELVGDGVEEGVLPLVAADLSDEEDGVEDDACDEGGEEDDAEDDEGEVSLVADDPVDIEGDETADEEGAEGDEEGDSSAASGDVHGLVEV